MDSIRIKLIFTIHKIQTDSTDVDIEYIKIGIRKIEQSPLVNVA